MKKPAPKRTNQANLEALGADRLAALLLELSESQPALKRRLRLEFAADAGTEALGAEIDKRLAAVGGSRARVSWRKRGEFLIDLDMLRTMIAGRLGALDSDAALDRLLVFFAMARGLIARVKDPKGEMDAVFQAAATDLGGLLGRTKLAPDVLADKLAAALGGAPDLWARWLRLALPGLNPAAARETLDRIGGAPTPSPLRLALIRQLADAAGEVDAYLATFTPEQRRGPEAGAAIATRLLAKGRAAEALTALETSDPRKRQTRPLWSRGVIAPPAESEAWTAAHIAALEALGRAADAQAARWEAFERTLSPEPLREHLKRLADFDDVVAADRALVHAAAWPDFEAGLAFLMDWPALAEAQAMLVARAAEVDGASPRLADWASRLEARHPLGALILTRAMIRAGAPAKPSRLLQAELADAQALAARAPDLKGVAAHEDFVRDLDRGGPRR